MRLQTLRRWLSLALPIGGSLVATFSTLSLHVGGFSEEVEVTVAAHVLGLFVGMLPAAAFGSIVGGAARGISFWRSVFAGTGGVMAGATSLAVLSAVGIDGDALSRLGETSLTSSLLATAQEAVTMGAFFGGMLATTYLLLGGRAGSLAPSLVRWVRGSAFKRGILPKGGTTNPDSEIHETTLGPMRRHR